VQVFALIGPSGTGKSHHASMVAAERGCDLILDDGLLVMEGRILAGRSAKREETRVAAVKRAVLTDPDHARAIKEQLLIHRPERFLVLGTSRHMVDRILEALDLQDAPVTVLPIGEVASAGDIEMARIIRRQQGKHVIPAPTLEVKKTFSGYLVDPLHFIVRGRERRQQLVEKSVVRPTYSSLGRFYIADTVVTTIAAHSARRVDGVTRVTRCALQSGEDGVAVRIELSVAVGVFIPDVLRAVQQAVRQQIEHHTALNVLAVDALARRLVVGGREVP
jgi:uncharacterized alkaline shock family protein YloU